MHQLGTFYVVSKTIFNAEFQTSGDDVLETSSPKRLRTDTRLTSSKTHGLLHFIMERVKYAMFSSLPRSGMSTRVTGKTDHFY